MWQVAPFINDSRTLCPMSITQNYFHHTMAIYLDGLFIDYKLTMLFIPFTLANTIHSIQCIIKIPLSLLLLPCK